MKKYLISLSLLLLPLFAFSEDISALIQGEWMFSNQIINVDYDEEMKITDNIQDQLKIKFNKENYGILESIDKRKTFSYEIEGNTLTIAYPGFESISIIKVLDKNLILMVENQKTSVYIAELRRIDIK